MLSSYVVIYLIFLMNCPHIKKLFIYYACLSVALSLDDQTGNFEVGKDFDALRINVAAECGPIDLIQDEEPKVGLNWLKWMNWSKTN